VIDLPSDERFLNVPFGLGYVMDGYRLTIERGSEPSPEGRKRAMNTASKFLAAAIAAATLATATVGTTSQAQAGGGNFIAGLVGGAIVGGAVVAASRPYYYGPGYYYGPAPAYVVPAPAYAPSCHKVWAYDAYGNPYKTKVCH